MDRDFLVTVSRNYLKAIKSLLLEIDELEPPIDHYNENIRLAVAKILENLSATYAELSAFQDDEPEGGDFLYKDIPDKKVIEYLNTYISESEKLLELYSKSDICPFTAMQVRAQTFSSLLSEDNPVGSQKE